MILQRRRSGVHALRLGALATLRRGRILLRGRRRGVLRPGRTVGFVAFAAFLLSLRRLGLLRMNERGGGGGEQAAEDSESGNFSRYVHEIRSCGISYRTPETLLSTN